MTTAATPSLEDALAGLPRALDGANRSRHTIAAYRTDLHQFLAWLVENNATVSRVDQERRIDITEYLAHLTRTGISNDEF